MFARLWGYVIAAGALLAAIFGALAYARRQGVKDERAAQTERALEHAKESNAIDKDVHARPDAAIADGLRKYQRD